MGSFDASPLGAFVRSPLDARNAPGGNVLIWLLNSLPLVSPPANFSQLLDIFRARELQADDSATWSGSIDDYKLIVWPVAASDPPWMESLRAGGWSGRILLTAEHNFNNTGTFNQSIAYVNSLEVPTGIHVTADGVFPTPITPGRGTLTAHPLNEGLTTIAWNLTSRVSGGSVVATVGPQANVANVPFIAERTSDGISWVVSGDSNILSNLQGASQTNADWLERLATVEVGA